jgi:hypothetical protein
MADCKDLKDVDGADHVTWQGLAEQEPELASLLHQARRVGAACRGWSDVSRAFPPFRSRLADLIGFLGRHRGHPVLGSTVAYRVAYRKLYDAVSGPLVRGRAASGAPGRPRDAVGITDRKEKIWCPFC